MGNLDYTIFVFKVVFMSDQINTLIASIRERFSRVNDQLLEEQAKNERIQVEVKELKSQLNTSNEKVVSLHNELKESEESNNDVSEQIVTRSEGTMITDEQIDELVKEIDYCIGQLKK